MMKSIVKPTLVLTLISAVVAGLLAFTYNAAGISELGKGIPSAELEIYTSSVLPTASKLVSVDVSLEDTSFMGAYKDEGGAGTAIHLSADGYGGKDTLKMLIGIDNDGLIAGCFIIENAETPGLGTKALEPSYTDQFIGKSKDNMTVSKSGGDIDAIAGSTKSSEFVGKAFLKALDFYESVKGEIQ